MLEKKRHRVGHTSFFFNSTMKYFMFVLKEQKKQHKIKIKSMNHSYLHIEQKLMKNDNKNCRPSQKCILINRQKNNLQL